MAISFASWIAIIAGIFASFIGVFASGTCRKKRKDK
jgi:hypothetical protein